MILSPIAAKDLPALLACYAAELDDSSRVVFRRIADPRAAQRALGAAALQHHRRACALARSFGMDLLPGSPALDYSWSGRALRCDIEAYVLVHEVAHFQIAPPARRLVIDFGLGAGPETGDREAAAAAQSVSGLDSDIEEAMASLLGILWEVEFDQPGLASFLDQNWLEGAGRKGTAAHFARIFSRLRKAGLVDAEGHPQPRLAHRPI